MLAGRQRGQLTVSEYWRTDFKVFRFAETAEAEGGFYSRLVGSGDLKPIQACTSWPDRSEAIILGLQTLVPSRRHHRLDPKGKAALKRTQSKR
jgi:hypothetical protein